MTRYLILIGMISTVLLVIIFIKEFKNKNLKYIILASPFIFAAVLYSAIFLLTKDMPPDVCDGAALMGILFSFMLIGIGIVLNLINILYLFINCKMKNKGLIIITLLSSCILIIYFMKSTKINKRISNDLGVEIPYALDFEYTDSHGGLHGDGITLAKAEIKDKDITNMLKGSKGNWNNYPLDKELATLLYGSENYFSELANNLEIGDVKDGYWIFIDRTGYGKQYLNKGEVYRYSRNYSIGLMDLDRYIFYYIKYDS